MTEISVVEKICKGAKEASVALASASTSVKNAVLNKAKELIFAKTGEILAANAKDIEKARQIGRNAAFIDRLALTEARIQGIGEGLDAVAALGDPVGEVVEHYTLKNGLDVKKVRAPLGVIGIIFEARPNVSVDAAALCIKSGNGVVLRGSRDSAESVKILVDCMKEALKINGLPEEIVGLIDPEDRAAVAEMLSYDKYIDVAIPRGGNALKKVVLENATMPVIASAGGNCHTYVAADADLNMAVSVILNAKTNRPSTCNALETVLVERSAAAKFLPPILEALQAAGVEIRGTAEVKSIFPDCIEVGEDEFSKEYDDMIIKVKVVRDLTEAIEHINKYGTNHSDAILTSDPAKAERFSKEVDSGAIYINASTRFTDGFELGLGAEMGISTQKLHVRGPIGLKELTSVKYVVTGNGQLRK
ncbi:MAG TPA: glutamate-5-semialdehyde dehydrogenase [Candidatus Stercoripulliclostridium merdigallinarum]|uniref:Gamma-glutamyl phosphate reductase n=1 Tax=Candidatus Stercoripulliclostridium merdigallinarum TaxID=2840951 RepID=A0A9D1MH99_9FIRM|nr:glutamate-5-semialdehyde dehydrogenase [Candidatus Stercoripulliclostridium merdigallinarum]